MLHWGLCLVSVPALDRGGSQVAVRAPPSLAAHGPCSPACSLSAEPKVPRLQPDSCLDLCLQVACLLVVLRTQPRDLTEEGEERLSSRAGCFPVLRGLGTTKIQALVCFSEAPRCK